MAMVSIQQRIQKLVLALSLLLLYTHAAPLRVRPAPSSQTPRDAPPPAIPPTSLASTHTTQQPSLAFPRPLAELLRTPSSTVTRLETIPPVCASQVAAGGECLMGVMEAVQATYDDCGDAWVVCRCGNSSSDADENGPVMPMDTAVTRLGQVPIGLRRYIGTVLVLPSTTSGDGNREPHAYTLTDGEIHVFGDLEVDSWVHESGHAYDWASGTPHSNSPAFLDALAKDTCVPDAYAATSAGEDFAQLTVVLTYTLLHGDGSTLPPGWSLPCMANQWAYVSALPVFTKSELFGGTCAIDGIGKDGFSRHSAAPPVLPAQTQPFFAPDEPFATPKSNLGDKHTSERKDNAAAPFSRVGTGEVRLWFLALGVGGVSWGSFGVI